MNICAYLDGAEPCIANFSPEEAAIYELMYNTQYYEKQALQTLAGGGSYWTSMKEGDTAITRDSALKVSAAYRALLESAQKSLYVAVSNWKVGRSIPATIDGSSLYSWPNP